MSDPIPTTYGQWHHCIEVECAAPLTPAFIAARLAALRDRTSDESARFIRLYGEAHWRSVVGWFERAQAEMRRGAA